MTLSCGRRFFLFPGRARGHVSFPSVFPGIFQTGHETDIDNEHGVPLHYYYYYGYYRFHYYYYHHTAGADHHVCVFVSSVH
nr:hypothetical protein BaRGS_004503 [Batillaria attramentaria]